MIDRKVGGRPLTGKPEASPLVQPARLLSLFGVDRCFLSVQFREQLLEPVFCELVGDILGDAPVVRDLLVEFGAFVAHGSPLKNRREQGALSVIDSCQGRGDDRFNSIDYARFPTAKKDRLA
jgi:hypothetical protein